MAIRHYKKISELDAITSASLATYVAGVDNGQTVKITLDVLADGVRNTINTLDIQRLNALESATSSYLTSLNGAISGSSQISNLGFITSSTQTDISALNSFTSSQQILNTAFTNGINARLQTSSFESFSSSVHSEILAATNEQSFNGLISGSSQLTSSYDSRYVLSGSITQTTWDNIANKPNDIISSSAQITAYGFASGSYETTGRDIISSSTQIESLGFVTSSQNVYITTQSFYEFTQSFYQFTGSIEGSFVPTSSFNNYTASISTSSLVDRLNNLESNTGSYETTGRNILSGSISYDDLTNIPNGIISSSEQLPNGLISSSAQIGGFETTGRGIVSSSAQITTLGFISSSQTIDTGSFLTTSSFNSFTQSYQTDSSSFDSRISSLVTAGVPAGTVSGSSQLTSSYDSRYTLSGSIQPLPSDLISSSAQITAYGFISSSADITSLNQFTSSYYTDSSSFDNRITSLINNTGSYETTGRGIISESVVTISETQPSTGIGNLWYDSNLGNLYLHYDTNTWIDTSNGVIQTIISDGSLLSTASFNQYTASVSTASLVDRLNTIENSTSSYETTGRGIISSSTQLTSLGYVTSGGNVTFNSVTANQYVVSSSVYYVTQSYSSGSTIFGNTIDDTHQFTGSVYISGGLSISPSASLDAKLWQLQDVNDTASGSIPNGYQLAWNTSTNIWEPTAGAAAKGNVRIFVAENASNANAFYFNAVQVTALSSASPGRDTAFMLTSNLLNTVKLYLRSDQNNSNSVRVDLYKNPSGQPFANATGSISNATNTLTQYNVLTYTFSGLTLNQFDSLHVKVTPTLNPGNLYGIITIE